jgi:hypothetical protein
MWIAERTVLWIAVMVFKMARHFPSFAWRMHTNILPTLHTLAYETSARIPATDRFGDINDLTSRFTRGCSRHLLPSSAVSPTARLFVIPTATAGVVFQRPMNSAEVLIREV